MSTKLKPFDLEAALRGEPVVTRDGRPVTQVTKFELKGSPFIVYGVINGGVVSFTDKGAYYYGTENKNDLFMATKTVKKEGWVNLYQSADEAIAAGTSYAYNTKEDAEKLAGPHSIATIKIEWEEEV